MGVVRDDVGQQAVALLDDVVVVWNRLAGLDRPILGSGFVRRRSGEEPGRIEAELEAVALARQRLDVAELEAFARRLEPGLRRACYGHRLRASAPRRDDSDD